MSSRRTKNEQKNDGASSSSRVAVTPSAKYVKIQVVPVSSNTTIEDPNSKAIVKKILLSSKNLFEENPTKVSLEKGRQLYRSTKLYEQTLSVESLVSMLNDANLTLKIHAVRKGVESHSYTIELPTSILSNLMCDSADFKGEKVAALVHPTEKSIGMYVALAQIQHEHYIKKVEYCTNLQGIEGIEKQISLEAELTERRLEPGAENVIFTRREKCVRICLMILYVATTILSSIFVPPVLEHSLDPEAMLDPIGYAVPLAEMTDANTSRGYLNINVNHCDLDVNINYGPAGHVVKVEVLQGFLDSGKSSARTANKGLLNHLKEANASFQGLLQLQPYELPSSTINLSLDNWVVKSMRTNNFPEGYYCSMRVDLPLNAVAGFVLKIQTTSRGGNRVNVSATPFPHLTQNSVPPLSTLSIKGDGAVSLVGLMVNESILVHTSEGKGFIQIQSTEAKDIVAISDEGGDVLVAGKRWDKGDLLALYRNTSNLCINEDLFFLLPAERDSTCRVGICTVHGPNVTYQVSKPENTTVAPNQVHIQSRGKITIMGSSINFDTDHSYHYNTGNVQMLNESSLKSLTQQFDVHVWKDESANSSQPVTEDGFDTAIIRVKNLQGNVGFFLWTKNQAYQFYNFHILYYATFGLTEPMVKRFDIELNQKICARDYRDVWLGVGAELQNVLITRGRQLHHVDNVQLLYHVPDDPLCNAEQNSALWRCFKSTKYEFRKFNDSWKSYVVDTSEKYSQMVFVDAFLAVFSFSFGLYTLVSFNTFIRGIRDAVQLKLSELGLREKIFQMVKPKFIKFEGKKGCAISTRNMFLPTLCEFLYQYSLSWARSIVRPENFLFSSRTTLRLMSSLAYGTLLVLLLDIPLQFLGFPHWGLNIGLIFPVGVLLAWIVYFEFFLAVWLHFTTRVYWSMKGHDVYDLMTDHYCMASVFASNLVLYRATIPEAACDRKPIIDISLVIRAIVGKEVFVDSRSYFSLRRIFNYSDGNTEYFRPTSGVLTSLQCNIRFLCEQNRCLQSVQSFNKLFSNPKFNFHKEEECISKSQLVAGDLWVKHQMITRNSNLTIILVDEKKNLRVYKQLSGENRFDKSHRYYHHVYQGDILLPKLKIDHFDEGSDTAPPFWWLIFAAWFWFWYHFCGFFGFICSCLRCHGCKRLCDRWRPSSEIGKKKGIEFSESSMRLIRSEIALRQGQVIKANIINFFCSLQKSFPGLQRIKVPKPQKEIRTAATKFMLVHPHLIGYQTDTEIDSIPPTPINQPKDPPVIVNGLGTIETDTETDVQSEYSDDDEPLYQKGEKIEIKRKGKWIPATVVDIDKYGHPTVTFTEDGEEKTKLCDEPDELNDLRKKPKQQVETELLASVLFHLCCVYRSMPGLNDFGPDEKAVLEKYETDLASIMQWIYSFINTVIKANQPDSGSAAIFSTTREDILDTYEMRSMHSTATNLSSYERPYTEVFSCLSFTTSPTGYPVNAMLCDSDICRKLYQDITGNHESTFFETAGEHVFLIRRKKSQNSTVSGRPTTCTSCSRGLVVLYHSIWASILFVIIGWYSVRIFDYPTENVFFPVCGYFYIVAVGVRLLWWMFPRRPHFTDTLTLTHVWVGKLFHNLLLFYAGCLLGPTLFFSFVGICLNPIKSVPFVTTVFTVGLLISRWTSKYFVRVNDATKVIEEHVAKHFRERNFSHAQLLKFFRDFDEDRDHVIDANEFIALLRSESVGLTTISKAKAVKVFAAFCDKDSESGKPVLTFSRFQTAIVSMQKYVVESIVSNYKNRQSIRFLPILLETAILGVVFVVLNFSYDLFAPLDYGEDLFENLPINSSSLLALLLSIGGYLSTIQSKNKDENSIKTVWDILHRWGFNPESELEDHNPSLASFANNIKAKSQYIKKTNAKNMEERMAAINISTTALVQNETERVKSCLLHSIADFGEIQKACNLEQWEAIKSINDETNKATKSAAEIAENHMSEANIKIIAANITETIVNAYMAIEGVELVAPSNSSVDMSKKVSIDVFELVLLELHEKHRMVSTSMNFVIAGAHKKLDAIVEEILLDKNLQGTFDNATNTITEHMTRYFEEEISLAQTKSYQCVMGLPTWLPLLRQGLEYQHIDDFDLSNNMTTVKEKINVIVETLLGQIDRKMMSVPNQYVSAINFKLEAKLITKTKRILKRIFDAHMFKEMKDNPVLIHFSDFESKIDAKLDKERSKKDIGSIEPSERSVYNIRCDECKKKRKEFIIVGKWYHKSGVKPSYDLCETHYKKLKPTQQKLYILVDPSTIKGRQRFGPHHTRIKQQLDQWNDHINSGFLNEFRKQVEMLFVAKYCKELTLLLKYIERIIMGHSEKSGIMKDISAAAETCIINEQIEVLQECVKMCLKEWVQSNAKPLKL